MEIHSVFINVINIVKHFFTLILKKFGYKIVPLDNYQEEFVEVNLNYPTESVKCHVEKSNGAKFFWSKKYYFGYTKYYEDEGNMRKYFKCGQEILWIKRTEK